MQQSESGEWVVINPYKRAETHLKRKKDKIIRMREGGSKSCMEQVHIKPFGNGKTLNEILNHGIAGMFTN